MNQDHLNHEMFRLGRDSRELTQGELAEASGVTQGTISKLEAGEQDVGEDVVGRIADALRYPPSFFRQPERYNGFGISVIFYRKRASTLQRHIRRLQAQVNLRRIQAKTILRDVTLNTTYDIQQHDISEFPGTPADIAAMVRANWKLTAGPIKNLVGLIENAGALVYRFPFGTTDIDAISQWPDDLPPLFFVNSQAPADRARFTLAHELGHMVMHLSASETMEDEANQFAGALLMPEVDIRHQLHDMSIERAFKLKPYWRASAQAIIRRARDLNCMDETRYGTIYRRFSQLGYRQSEPYPIADEEPQLVKQLVEAHFNQGAFTVDELARMTHLYPDEFRSQYLGHSGSLRLAL